LICTSAWRTSIFPCKSSISEARPISSVLASASALLRSSISPFSRFISSSFAIISSAFTASSSSFTLISARNSPSLCLWASLSLSNSSLSFSASLVLRCTLASRTSIFSCKLLISEAWPHSINFSTILSSIWIFGGRDSCSFFTFSISSFNSPISRSFFAICSFNSWISAFALWTSSFKLPIWTCNPCVSSGSSPLILSHSSLRTFTSPSFSFKWCSCSFCRSSILTFNSFRAFSLSAPKTRFNSSISSSNVFLASISFSFSIPNSWFCFFNCTFSASFWVIKGFKRLISWLSLSTSSFSFCSWAALDFELSSFKAFISFFKTSISSFNLLFSASLRASWFFSGDVGCVPANWSVNRFISSSLLFWVTISL